MHYQEAEKNERIWQAQGEYKWANAWGGYARYLRATLSAELENNKPQRGRNNFRKKKRYINVVKCPCNNGADRVAGWKLRNPMYQGIRI